LRGKTGPRGPAGPPGKRGPNHTAEIAALSAQISAIVKELQIQLMRIAQIQAQLDRLAHGHEPVPADDPEKARIN
jgi:hypothetical protein